MGTVPMRRWLGEVLGWKGSRNLGGRSDFSRRSFSKSCSSGAGQANAHGYRMAERVYLAIPRSEFPTLGRQTADSTPHLQANGDRKMIAVAAWPLFSLAAEAPGPLEAVRRAMQTVDRLHRACIHRPP